MSTTTDSDPAAPANPASATPPEAGPVPAPAASAEPVSPAPTEAGSPPAPTIPPPRPLPRPGPGGGGSGGPRRFGAPPQPGGPRPGGSNRPFPRGDRTPNPGGKPETVEKRDFHAGKPNSRELDRLIEEELNQAMAGFDVTSTVVAEAAQRAVGSVGGKKKGRIVGIHGKDVFVEVPGGRGQGVLPLQQFEDKPPVIGDEVEFEIERYDSANGLVLLTREGSTQSISDWSSVSYGMIVEAKVTGTNKNKTGLLVEVNGIKAFMPLSQADMYRVEDADQFVNQRLKCMVTEVNPHERNLIVSRRAVMEQERQKKAEEFWATVAEGQTRKGIIRSVKAFGAFADLGGADGLIPISEFSWQRVNDLNELVKVGDTVDVLINRIDFETRKISLSMKALQTSPWDAFAERVKAGARVKGKVTRTADFGAFVELEAGVEGLIHISELSTQRVRRARDVVQEGQMVEVEVLHVDLDSRRIALSLKAIRRAEELAAEEAEDAEEEADRKAAEELAQSRPVNPKLRGGIGSGTTLSDRV